MRTDSTHTAPAGLPPGPRLPRAVQGVIWYRRAQWLMDQCQARFGDMFTLKIANEGTWVITSNPETIKQVFTGDPRLLHAGEANRILLPVLGPDSVLLLDDAPHLRQRKLMLPAFHGARMQRYGALMADVAAREIERWPLGEPYPLRPRMQAMTLEIVLRAVFGVSEGPRMEELRRELRGLMDTVTDPLKGVAMLVLGADRITRIPAFRRELERINAPIYAEIAERRTASDLAERDDIMSLLLQATHGDGSPMSDSELRDELLTLLVAGHETTANVPVLGGRAVVPPSRADGAPDRGGARWRGDLPAGDDPGDVAPAPGDLDRAAQTAGADGAGRPPAAGRRLDRAFDPSRPPPGGHLPGTE